MGVWGAGFTHVSTFAAGVQHEDNKQVFPVTFGEILCASSVMPVTPVSHVEQK